MSNKLSVAIIYGGKSVEHQISINSAKNIFEYIDRDKYDPIAIGISPTGDWVLKESIDNQFDGQPQLALALSTTNKGFKNLTNDEFIRPDIIFPVLHGTDGEDGSIQGLLKSMEIPFVGTGVLGSAISMSKLYTKRLLEAAGIPVSKYLTYDYPQKSEIKFEHVESTLGLPFMAKAANLGSSVGVVKVKSKADFKKALDEAFKFDNTILFEQYITGRELECSVMGNETPVASNPAEIVVSKNYEFYTYEAKYLDPNAVELHVPAKVDASTVATIRELSIKAYKALSCDDFARVDLFLTDNGKILINEINTIPGFTNSSMFPMMWQERGISFTDLISELIAIALKREGAAHRITNQYQP
ncbi:D-alanine--D-alanine ligase family protein [Fulvivirga lutimaris]|uniref:D-alanine--D-alanine ligase family protein n=1 Tax=Fulvivirga lutimaris TaxID=1819566 RepID=UPI0012BD0203|nr:D-alanine--D-alanine ligase family protein [Fulvivirga lutimaris]MTI39661.1 D-alanine--D-alanine ligase [Fulvivirga lutimaris]